MANLNRDVNGKDVKSAYVCAPFDEAKAQLEKVNYAVITPKEFARLRMAKRENHSVSLNGAYTSMGDVMIPKKGRYLTNFSLVMEKPIEATQAHREAREFAVSNEDAERALASGSVVVPYAQSSVPTNRFGEDPITRFLFGELAQDYGTFLKESRYEIQEMPLIFDSEATINAQKTPFANQLWLHGLVDGGRSALLGSRYLIYYDVVRGVRYVEPRSGEDCAKKSDNVIPYKPKDIERELRRLSRLETEIQKSKTFLESLRASQ